jgi:HEAT repeat protein
MAGHLGMSGGVLFAALVAAGCGSHEVLYKGQPAPYWVRQLEDRDPETRGRAAFALGAIAPDGDSRLIAPALAAALVDCLHHPDRYSGEVFDFEVLNTIRKGGPAWAAPALPALVEMLRANDKVRLSAVYSLGSLGPLAKSAEPELQKLLQDPDQSIREAAEAALKEIHEAEGAGSIGN